MAEKIPESKALIKIPERLSSYLAQLKSDDRALLEAVFRAALLEPRELDVLDLWEQQELPITYWILLMTGVNQEEEMKVAQTLLSWNTFFSKHSARVLCIQSSERNEFRCCSASFDVVNCPTLLFSDSPEMESFVKVEPELLFALSGQPGGLQRFLTKVHSMVENGESLVGIKNMLLTEKFWSTLKLVYQEVKGFISFSAKKEL
jgi:hypothetical protein